MSIESEIAALTTATTDLLDAVEIKKDELRNLASNIDYGTGTVKTALDEIKARPTPTAATIPYGSGTVKDALDQINAGPTPSADMIAYGGEYASVKEALDALLYKPVDITAFNLVGGSATNEIGTSVTNLSLAWTINKPVTAQTMNSTTILAAARTFAVSGTVNSSQTWNLSATDGNTSDTASVSIQFLSKRYWGVSDQTTLNDAQVIGLSGSELTTSKNKTVTYDATGGRYPYYCYPASFGALTGVTVNGLSFSDFTVTSRLFVNASGYSTSYNIVRFNNIQNGSSISVAWA